MEENISNLAEIQRIAYFNKKRKIQAELLGMPFPKHVCQYQIHANDRLFGSRTEPKMFERNIFAMPAESDAQSSKDSNSFHGDADADAVMFTHSAAKTPSTYTKTHSSNEPSTSWVSCGASNLDVELDSPEVRSSTKPSFAIVESFSMSESNCEDDLLEFSNYADYNCFEDGSDDNSDKELYDLLCSNGIAPSDYLLSSGRWSVHQGTEHRGSQESVTQKLTIDKEFEQYFSTLML